MQPDLARGTILLAHGSRDPLWRKPIEAVAEQMRGLAPAVHVRCAYLELSVPDLPSSATELVTLGVTSITVVPLFFGVGKHARDDLPLLISALRATHPAVTFDLRPAIGEQAQVIELIARIALA
ncbi:MAG: cobalamin biosynthesis protein CbiX [Rhodoferax sp.]|uniref:sirohydrochlorin chelatase n=1 Tax=Rhodoferax sp. TaxID=50421 RepID=UPI0013FE8D62|nr:CbiX/SirB N-terminal domain-containing protein [Rhodoferax sp.]NDP39532.1 cobalamin biosynthesis protein CbiX [Rhodoferax sp.]